MVVILTGITSLLQYLECIKHKSALNRPKHCPNCGKNGLWFHGCYSRKADRSGRHEESLNPIYIQRFYCPSCEKTFSVLPECIPPHRWHLWETQQAALLLLLAGNSVYAAAKEIAPSRHTITRWLARLKEQFLLHKDAICNHIAALGRAVGFAGFWEGCLKEMLLSKVMRLCHVSGVSVP